MKLRSTTAVASGLTLVCLLAVATKVLAAEPSALGKRATRTEAAGSLQWPSYPSANRREWKAPKPPPDSARKVLGVRVDGEVIGAAEAVFGKTVIHEGDSGHPKRWACWVAANGDGTVLYAENEDVGDGIRILGREMAFDRSECAKSKRVTRQLATGGGLRLDLTKDEAKAKLGKLSLLTRDTAEHYGCARRPMTADERARIQPSSDGAFMDVCSGFSVVFDGDKVVGLGVGWVETF